MLQCGVQEHLGAHDVGADELGGAGQRAVDVRLGREVDDLVVLGDEGADDVRVADVADDEPEAGESATSSRLARLAA